VPGTQIYYSIQGNILRPGEVVPNAVKAFLAAKGALTDRVMAAMDAADASGGDNRCTCPPPPADGSAPLIPCDSKTAHVAYILMAERNDTNGDSHNNGARIIDRLSQDPAFQSRQFGIVDLTGRSAGHSGLTNGYVSQDIQGRVPGTQIYYSIQGNILRPGEVVPNAVKAFLAAKGALTDRVMAAMDAADASGGDSRCTCPPPPADGSAPFIPCDSKTAHVAYILMAERNDTNGDSHNNGKYAMYLTVTQPESGGPNVIHAGENLNPVKTLRMRYDAWRKAQPASYK